MEIFNDIMSFELILLNCLIIGFLLPLVPIIKLRYYSCYVCYGLVMSLVPILLAPIILMRPKNIKNLRMTGGVMRHFTKIIGIKWELRNGKILRQDQGAVVVANHQSLFDIMGMVNIWNIMDKCTVIAKKELLYMIPLGTLAWLSGLIFIDRNNKASAINTLETATKVMQKEKAKLWIFPEGTRNKKGDGILPFKNGAFKTAIESHVPIIPIVYSPYFFIDSKNKTFSKGKIIMSVLDPISTEALTINDLETVKKKVHKLMSDEYQKLKNETAVQR